MPHPIAIPGALLEHLPTPCYVVDAAKVEANCRKLASVQQATGARVLLALKGFAMWPLFPMMQRHLAGAAASSLDEALLAREHFVAGRRDKQIHVYAPAYRDDQFDQIARLADHIVFNSTSQWRRLRTRVRLSPRPIDCGLRINPQHSEVAVPLYDPCAPGSRLGTTVDQIRLGDLDGITGLHFHTLCELNSDSLERTLAAVEKRFAPLLPRMTWMNFGGGHHITRDDYDLPRLIRIIQRWRSRWGHEIYLEPGEAAALNTGVLVATVLDVIHNQMDIAILDTSATAHMPDVLEMPYRPVIEHAAEPGEKPYTCRLGGLTCLAGDVIGDYAFDQPLKPGDRLVFGDMAHYTMVKNTTFNGVTLPNIAVYDSRTGESRIVRTFTYPDYRDRLG